MKIASIVLLLIFLCFSCTQKQVNPTPPAVKAPYAALPMQEKIPSTEKDPYFHETTTISSENGPRSISRGMIQDTDGTMWFATWEGIVSFDGKQFTNYTNKENLRRFHMFSAFQDSRGEYWFGSIRAGAYHYDGKSWKNITAEAELPNDIVLCFHEDSKGRVWIGTGDGISVYDGKSYKKLGKEDGLLNGDVNSIVEDRDGRIWVVTRGQTFIYEDGNFTEFMQPNGSSYANMRDIIVDRNGRKWMGGNSGLWVIDGENQTKLNSNFAGYIMEDSQGDIWVGAPSETHGRNWNLLKYEENSIPISEFVPTIIKEQEGQVFDIVEDKEGNIWYGTEVGIIKYDGETHHRFW